MSKIFKRLSNKSDLLESNAVTKDKNKTVVRTYTVHEYGAFFYTSLSVTPNSHSPDSKDFIFFFLINL